MYIITSNQGRTVFKTYCKTVAEDYILNIIGYSKSYSVEEVETNGHTNTGQQAG